MNQTACPRCSYHPGNAPLHFDSEDEEVTIISEETRRINDLIRGLYGKRARYLRRLNAIRSSTKSLPPEILTDIFQRVCSSLKDSSGKYPQFTLGAVSTHWRTVVWNSPQLWNNVLLEPLGMPVDSLTQLLQLHLDNAGSAPVTLRLESRPGHPHVEVLRQGQLYREWMSDCALSLQSSMRLPQNTSKVHTLHLHSTLPVFLLVLPYLSSLRELSLSFNFRLGGSNDDDISAIKNRWDRVQYELPWMMTITSLNLDRVPVDICFGLLTRCPNLIHFSSASLGQSSVARDPCTTTITIPHLRHLKWSPNSADRRRDLDVLRLLRFPELQYFGFPVWDNDKLITHLLKFLAALSPDLDTLEFHFLSRLTVPRLPLILKSVSQITQLIFTGFLPANLLDFLTTLQSLPLLPLLRVFKYIYLGLKPWTPSDTAASIFLQLMEERRGSGAKGFFFELVRLKIYWAPDVQGSLRLLVEQGFELEIVEGRVPVRWLRGQIQE